MFVLPQNNQSQSWSPGPRVSWWDHCSSQPQPQHFSLPCSSAIWGNSNGCFYYPQWSLFLMFISPNPATGKSVLGFNLRAQQRHRDGHMYASSNQRMTYKTKNPNPPVSWPFFSLELHFISQYYHHQGLFQYFMKAIQTVSQNGIFILNNFVI